MVLRESLHHSVCERTAAASDKESTLSQRRMGNEVCLRLSLKQPKFSIADKLATGDFEEYRNANAVTTQAVSFAWTKGVVEVVMDGPGNCIKSHLLTWDNREARLFDSIPNTVNEDFQVIYAGTSFSM